MRTWRDYWAAVRVAASLATSGALLAAEGWMWRRCPWLPSVALSTAGGTGLMWVISWWVPDLWHWWVPLLCLWSALGFWVALGAFRRTRARSGGPGAPGDD